MRRTDNGSGVPGRSMVAALAALALGHAVAAQAQQPPPPAAAPTAAAAPAPALPPGVDYKRAVYLRYCSSCHGDLGDGDGPVAKYMTPRPTNLSLLMKKHDDTFPFQGTLKQLEGADNVRAHGNPEAPVWGESWKDQPGLTPERRAEAHGKAVMITEYLLSIQERPPLELKFVPPKQ